MRLSLPVRYLTCISLLLRGVRSVSLAASTADALVAGASEGETALAEAKGPVVTPAVYHQAKLSQFHRLREQHEPDSTVQVSLTLAGLMNRFAQSLNYTRQRELPLQRPLEGKYLDGLEDSAEEEVIPEERGGTQFGMQALLFIILGGVSGFLARGYVGVKVQSPEAVKPLLTGVSEKVNDLERAEPPAPPKPAPPASAEPSPPAPATEVPAEPSPPPVQAVKAKGKGKPPGAPPAAPPPPPKGKGKQAPKAQTTKGWLKFVKPHRDEELAPPFGRKLHWRVLADTSLEHTVFGEIDAYGPRYPKLNIGRMRELFLAKQPAYSNATLTDGQPQQSRMDRRRTMRSDSSVSGVCLLSEKWAQNFQIIMRQVPVPTEVIAQVLRGLCLDNSEVTVDLLDHVASNLLPPLLESPKLFEYTGDASELRAIERHLLPLTKVPRLQARMRVLLFHSGSQTAYDAIMQRIDNMRSGCMQLRKSAALKHLLASGLRVGNYLNFGLDHDSKCVAHGVATSSFLKLGDFRTQHTGDASAMHCVVLHLQAVSPNLLPELHAELSHIIEGPLSQREEVTEIFDAVKAFVDEAAFVNEEASNGVSNGYESAPLAILQKGGTEAADKSNRLQADWASVYDVGLRALEYFGERSNYKPLDEEGPAAIQRFFAAIKELVTQLEASWRELTPSTAAGSKLRLSTTSSTMAFTDEELASRAKEPCLQQ